MNYMKIKKIIISVLFFISADMSGILSSIINSGAGFNNIDNDMNFDMSDDMAQEFEDFLAEFNNLPADQQQALADLSNQIESMMQDEGLDPSNPDDLIRWIEKQEAQDQENNKMPEREIKPVVEPKKVIPVKAGRDINDAITMLQALNKSLAVFRQKASCHGQMSNDIGRLNQELNEFTYFLNILTNKEITKYLISEEFNNLYNNLNQLYNTIVDNDHNIQICESSDQEIENPYEILGISSKANASEIEAAYNNLKDIYATDSITENLKEQNYSEKDIEKKLKQAKLSFSFIQSAYDSLKDPKEKVQIDRDLREQENIENKLQRQSLDAFEKIKTGLTNSIFNILSDIKKLLEKYNPEELAKAKAHQDLEKKLLEESKKPVRFVQSPPLRETTKPKEEQYKDFWSAINREERQKEQERLRYQGQQIQKQYQDEYERNYKNQQRQEDNKRKPEGGSGARPQDKKPEEKKKEEPKKDIAKKPEVKKKEEPKSVEPKLIDAIVNIRDVSKLLSNVKNSVKIEKITTKVKDPTQPLEADNIEIERQYNKVKLDNILNNLDTYLKSKTAPTTAATRNIAAADKETISNLKEYFKQSKIKDIWQLLKNITDSFSKDKKIEDKNQLKELQDLVKKYSKIAKNWDDNINKILNDIHNIDKDKADYYGLSINARSIKNPTKDTQVKPEIKQKFNYLEDMNLAKYRKYITDIKNFFDIISKKTTVKK